MSSSSTDSASTGGAPTAPIPTRRSFNITEPGRRRRTTTNNKTTRKKQQALFPPVYYYSQSSKRPSIRTHDLPREPNHVGIYSPYYFLWAAVSMVVPVAYSYILLILLRDVCVWLPELGLVVALHLPWLSHILELLQNSSKLVEAWCVLEALFFICLQGHWHYLQRRDPLEQSLSSAPFMRPDERTLLWRRMMDTAAFSPAEMISGWFFDQPIECISRYDVREFITWSMFEGRNQEHLTSSELQQLEEFVTTLEHRISVHFYGTKEEEEVEETHNDDDGEETTDEDDDDDMSRLVPRKMFRFPELEPNEPPNFFSNLYESYRKSYETYKTMLVENSSDFHPVEDFKNFMAASILEAEESARATADKMSEQALQVSEQARQTATQMYSTLIPSGSKVEQRLHQTHAQLIHAFHSVTQGMTERLETARWISSQRRALRQQLLGYREMLDKLQLRAGEVPSQQMAALMRRITESNRALERLEARAKDAFDQATGYARKNLQQLQQQQQSTTTGIIREPQRYAKYSSDPLLGVATYPLGFHLLILGATELPLRYIMAKKGFERRSIGPVNYYYHPGTNNQFDSDSDDSGSDDDDNSDTSEDGDSHDKNTPLVFVHGIGIGLITYQPLIDAMLATGRPIFLPELPFVSGFRPWQGPNAVLPPAVVCSTMTAMLATHGYLKGAFLGHSYGTSWLSYMCKYAPDTVAALLFLDPICFCLHAPRLTKKFVYHAPDPGTISYIIRTDLIVNWTIQRSFPWAWIILFTEQIHVPCSVFLSEQDALVPAQKVEDYLTSKGVSMVDFTPGMGKEPFARQHENNGDVSGCVFRGHGHGDWTDYPTHTVPVIAEALQVLCDRAEQSSSSE